MLPEDIIPLKKKMTFEEICSSYQKEKPKFCRDCGSELLETVKLSYLYDPQTGNRSEVIRLKCKKQNLFNKSFHDEWINYCEMGDWEIIHKDFGFF